MLKRIATIFGLLVVGIIVSFAQHALVKYYKGLYEKQKEVAIVLKEANDDLKALIREQNRAVDEFKRISKIHERTFNSMQGQIDNELKKLGSITDSLQALPPPLTCSDSMDYLKNMKDYIQWEN